MASHALGHAQAGVTVVQNLPSIPVDARGNITASKVAIRTETVNLRYRDDGVDPTTSVGMLLTTTDPIFIYDGEIGKMRIVAVSATATVDVAYYN